MLHLDYLEIQLANSESLLECCAFGKCIVGADRILLMRFGLSISGCDMDIPHLFTDGNYHMVGD